MSNTYRRYIHYFDDCTFNHFTMRWRKENGYGDKTRKSSFPDKIPTKEFPLEAAFGKSFRDGTQGTRKKWYKEFCNRKLRRCMKQKIIKGEFEPIIRKKDILWLIW